MLAFTNALITVSSSQGFVGGLKFIHNGLFYKFATDNSNFFGGTDFASKVLISTHAREWKEEFRF